MSSEDDKRKFADFFRVDQSSMRTSKVDHVSSMLTSLLVMVALAVIILGTFFVMNLTWPTEKAFHIEPERISGRGDNAPGFERDFDPPAIDEVEQLAEPAAESSLALVADALTSVLGVMEAIEGASNAAAGQGDSRQAGPQGKGDDIVPRFKRWDLRFQARDRRSYAAQLDFFGIELGAYGGTNPVVDYASKLSGPIARRSGAPGDDDRLYFLSLAEGVLKEYDKQFLQGAGVSLGTRVPIKFLPKETEEMLAQAEALYYRDNLSPEVLVTNIAKTVFECRAVKSGGGFEFVVIDQRYRGKTRK